MNLEDHLGDIIRKARTMSGVPAAAAASAAGVSEAELSALEASGQLGAKINLSKLAPLIGLNPQKLEAITSGWLPAPKDTFVLMMRLYWPSASPMWRAMCAIRWATRF